MRLVRYGDVGREKPGIIDAGGGLRDLSGVINDVTSRNLSPSALARIQAIDPESLPRVQGSPRYGVPIADVGKFVAIGLNYTDHAKEANLPIPAEPVLFTKAVSCLSGPNDDVVLPRGSTKTDWEVELGIVIGSRASYVEESAALSYVAGFCLINDVSEREYQFERGGSWDKGKGCDTFGPVGPWLVTTEELSDPQAVELWLDVNGTRRQTGHTRNMIFPVTKIVSYLSQFVTLEPGDLIATGTPAGVGFGAKPAPCFLAAGDVVTLGSPLLGSQTQRVIRRDER